VPIRVIVIEDHPLMLKAIVQELDAQDDIQVVGTATHGAELHRLARECSPDVVVLDLGMAEGEFEPITAVTALCQAHPNVQVLVLTGYDDQMLVRELIGAGARGYLLKSDDLSLCLPDGVRTLYRGGRFYSPSVTEKYFASADAAVLTGQQLALLQLAARGLSNARIGQELGLSEKTVRNYFSVIYDKLHVQVDGDNVNPRVTAINKAREMGLLREK
jgi:DNA-binding NarL/FixJ family response regulator